MSIPGRLWRVIRGHMAVARQRSEAEAAAQAAAELEEHLEAAKQLAPGARVETPRLPRRAPSGPPRDPLEADYRLLQLAPGSDCDALEAAYQARLAELHPEAHAPGSPERRALEARRVDLTEAYERLRDAINVTETRFEKLEFDS